MQFKRSAGAVGKFSEVRALIHKQRRHVCQGFGVATTVPAQIENDAAGAFENIVLNSMLSADPTKQTLQKVPYVGVQFVGIPEFQHIGTLVTQNLAGAVAGKTSVDSALQLSQTQVTRIMKQAGYIK